MAEPLAGLALDAVYAFREECERSRTKPIVIPGVARLLDCPPGPDKALTLLRLDDNWPLPVAAIGCSSAFGEDTRWCVIQPGTGLGPVVPPNVEIYDIPDSP